MISFVYFDVGGVVIRDFSKTNKWEEMWKEMGVNEENKQTFIEWWRIHEGNIELNFDVDKQTPDLIGMGLSVPLNYSMVDDFVSRFETNPSLWPVINKIKEKGCETGLLTNMYPGMFNKIETANLLPTINWDVIIDSSKVGVKKPDIKIFEIAFKRAREFHPRGVFGGRPVHPGGEILAAEEMLFVDNKQENLEPAKNLGWQTFYYDSGDYDKSSQLLDEYIKKHL